MQQSNPSADSFGSANSAASIHSFSYNRDTVQPAAYQNHAQVPPPGAILADTFIKSFIGLMDNMASSATNDKAVLEQIVANTTTQYTAIKMLMQELKNQRGSNNSGRNSNSTNQTQDGNDMRKFKKRNATLQHAIVKGWTKGGFFSSHGHGVTSGHGSRTFPNQKPGHIEMATRENPAGTGKYSNKGWDTFWT